MNESLSIAGVFRNRAYKHRRCSTLGQHAPAGLSVVLARLRVERGLVEHRADVNSHEQSHRALMRAEFQTNRLPLVISLVKRIQHGLGISRASVVVGNGGDLEEHGWRIAEAVL